jgi:hypothetical protein
MWFVVAAALLAATAATDPTDALVADVPPGFEPAADAPTELTYDEYAALSPDAVEHLDPASADAGDLRAAVDVWTSAEGDVLVREVTLWATDDAAHAFVEQAVAVGTDHELSPTEPPFDGGVAFVGADQGLWTRTMSWRQGRYAMRVSHFAIIEGDETIIDEAAVALADDVERTTGNEIVAIDVARPDGEPTTDPGGGLPILTVLTWSAIVAAGIGLFLSTKRRRAAVQARSIRSGGGAPTSG